jgi:hypothetical protein
MRSNPDLLARAVAAAGLILGCTANAVAAQQEEISPACGDYHPNVIVVDGRVTPSMGHCSGQS